MNLLDNKSFKTLCAIEVFWFLQKIQQYKNFLKALSNKFTFFAFEKCYGKILHCVYDLKILQNLHRKSMPEKFFQGNIWGNLMTTFFPNNWAVALSHYIFTANYNCPPWLYGCWTPFAAWSFCICENHGFGGTWGMAPGTAELATEGVSGPATAGGTGWATLGNGAGGFGCACGKLAPNDGWPPLADDASPTAGAEGGGRVAAAAAVAPEVEARQPGATVGLAGIGRWDGGWLSGIGAGCCCCCPPYWLVGAGVAEGWLFGGHGQ